MKLGAFIVPTGIGASIGGFAGDASFWARKFSEKCKLIVNPNVVNAACFSGITDNMLYVEGYTLDDFFKGNIGLKESNNNKIGVIFDKSIPQNVLNIHLNTINAVKTVYGINIIDYEITEHSVGVNFHIDESGISTGNIDNLSTLKKATQKLIKKGAEAIAVVCHFPESEDQEYEQGIGVDPVGGVEAIISHYISKEFKVPAAHAPAFSDITIPTEIVNPKCSAEYITPTFLPCILLGLNNAPKIVSKKSEINVCNIDFLVMPYNSLGSIPALEMNRLNKKIYVIKENKTVLNTTAEKLFIKCDIINTYEELLELI